MTERAATSQETAVIRELLDPYIDIYQELLIQAGVCSCDVDQNARNVSNRSETSLRRASFFESIIDAITR